MISLYNLAQRGTSQCYPTNPRRAQSGRRNEFQASSCLIFLILCYQNQKWILIQTLIFPHIRTQLEQSFKFFVKHKTELNGLKTKLNPPATSTRRWSWNNLWFCPVGGLGVVIAVTPLQPTRAVCCSFPLSQPHAPHYIEIPYPSASVLDIFSTVHMA